MPTAPWQTKSFVSVHARTPFIKTKISDFPLKLKHGTSLLLPLECKVIESMTLNQTAAFRHSWSYRKTAAPKPSQRLSPSAKFPRSPVLGETFCNFRRQKKVAFRISSSRATTYEGFGNSEKFTTPLRYTLYDLLLSMNTTPGVSVKYFVSQSFRVTINSQQAPSSALATAGESKISSLLSSSATASSALKEETKISATSRVGAEAQWLVDPGTCNITRPTTFVAPGSRP